MSDDQYPAFEGGQTLTAPDLNELRAFLHRRDRVLGRLTGFGISCGLEGTVVAGTILAFTGGLAADQTGEPLLMAAAQTLPLPPVALPAGSFDFVAEAAGGFSVVLEVTDTVEPAPDCGQAGCEGHAELHTRAVALQVVPGRITGPRFDFADEPLLAADPMLLSLTSAPQGSYVTLRDAVAKRLKNAGSPLIDPALIAKLEGTSLAAGDLPGVKGYKAAFINQVFFTTLDLLRCEALMDVGCARTAVRPGVVLGWLRQVGGAWTWDCAYRHAWEPPAGLTVALAGGTCSDPCAPVRDALEAIIAAYAPPDPPPAGGGGGKVVVPGDVVLCTKGTVSAGGRCLNLHYPPEKIEKLTWIEEYRDVLGPIWNPPVYELDQKTAVDRYGGLGWEYFGKGVVNGLGVLGGTKASAVGALDTVTKQAKGIALDATDYVSTVSVTTPANAAKMPGYQPGATFNVADTVVLSADADGMVVAIGRVPAGFVARQLGTQLPAATATANRALDVAKAQEVGVRTVTEDVVTLKATADRYRQFEQGTTEWRGSVDKQLGSVVTVAREAADVRVGTKLDEMQRRVSTVEGVVDTLRDMRSTPERVRVDRDLAQGMVEFAGTVSAGLTTLVTEENRSTLGRYVGRAERVSRTLEAVAAGGDPLEIGEAVVRLLGTMRTAVAAAGIDRQVADQLDAQLDAMRGLLG